MAVKAKPDGYHTITPAFVVKDAERFMGFVKTVLGAQEKDVMRTPDGRLAHAELQVGDSLLMLGEGEPMALSLYLYLEDTDGAYRKALQAGATSEQEPIDQFWGDRMATVRDAWGNRWSFATHVEDVAPEEMMKRMAAMAPA